ncbi:MAG: HmuY family protein [Bacteroidota bacterium]
MNKLNSILAVALLAIIFTACKKDNNPVIVVPPSDGSTLTLNGLIATESGSNAGNSVYVDFSKEKQVSVDRSSWDLGFYAGADFKVILNSTKGASAVKIEKTDLNAVTEADLVPENLEVVLGNTDEAEFKKVDDPREANILNKTAIAIVSSVDADNKVYLISIVGGSHGTSINVDNVYKIRVIRKAQGYTLQYAKLKETSFKTLDVTKDALLNFNFISLTQGKTVTVEPEKAEWDMVWTWSLYYGLAGSSSYVYGYSDVVFINNISNVTAAQVSTTTKSYADFAEADLAGITFSSARDVIGSKWRNTTGSAVGVIPTVFYVVKDGSGNIYKLKFNSFISNDGGERGRPVIEYKLVKKG